MKLTYGSHLAVKGAMGSSCRRGRERNRAGAATTFRLPVLTVSQRVTPPWRATYANVVKMKDA
jgi:hypothetical protein